MLKPWEKETRYQGHETWDFLIRSCTREMITSRVSRAGSHHSWVFSE